jgi:hypothetical protein
MATAEKHEQALKIGGVVVEPGGETGEIGGEFRTTSGGIGVYRLGKRGI